MDAITAILACSLYADDGLVRAIVDNAHDNPLAIFTPDRERASGSTSSFPETLEAATAQLREIGAHGGLALVGLMQVPVAWASIFGRVPQDLFDPCINVSIGSAMLSEFDYVCGKHRSSSSDTRAGGAPSSAPKRSCVLRHYAQAIGMTELLTVVALNLRYQPGPLSPPADAPILAAPPTHGLWGADRLLIPARIGERPNSTDAYP